MLDMSYFSPWILSEIITSLLIPNALFPITQGVLDVD